MGNWFFAAFAFVSMIAIIIAICSYFATRRDVDKLEVSSIDAWKKMESDRVEGKDAISDLRTEIAELRSTVVQLSTAVNLLNVNLINKK